MYTRHTCIWDSYGCTQRYVYVHTCIHKLLHTVGVYIYTYMCVTILVIGINLNRYIYIYIYVCVSTYVHFNRLNWCVVSPVLGKQASLTDIPF